jgi:hypothetical protein
VGINQTYPMLFQNTEYRFTQISLCAKLNMVTVVLGRGLKKVIQGFCPKHDLKVTGLVPVGLLVM